MTNFSKTQPLGLAHQINWERQYQVLLKQFLKTHHSFDGSEVCAYMRRNGLGEPVHHNHWVGQIPYYAGLGWYTRVGSGVPSGSQAHINSVGLWRSNSFKGKKAV